MNSLLVTLAAGFAAIVLVVHQYALVASKSASAGEKRKNIGLTAAVLFCILLMVYANVPSRQELYDGEEYSGAVSFTAAAAGEKRTRTEAPSIKAEDVPGGVMAPDAATTKLISRITPVPGGRVVVWSVSDDRPGMSYALHLSEAFKAAGWHVETRQAISEVPVSGIIVRSKAEKPVNYSGRIMKAMQSTERKVTYFPDTSMEPGCIEIIIGRFLTGT